MAYQRKTLDKTAPQAPGKVLLRTRDYLVHWHFATRRAPAPKRWVNLTVFFLNPDLRRRSYRLGWNGQRFSDGPVLDLLHERHPGFAGRLLHQLAPYCAQLIKPTRITEDHDDD